MSDGKGLWRERRVCEGGERVGDDGKNKEG